mmetsp:Transcript_17257/g.43384  ORF Transcript_17257/g.43384 Transcript_17257/m.43384 type:complete len:486 (+) Transcript_17257:106-1563(+)
MLLDEVAMTASGRAQLVASEVEQSVLDPVDLCFESEGGLRGELADKYRDVRCQITTHRLLWLRERAAGGSCGLPLECVQGLQLKKSMLSGASLVVLVPLNAGGRPLQCGASGVARIGELRIKSGAGIGKRTSSIEDFMTRVQEAISAQAWLRDTAASSTTPGAQADAELLGQMQAMGFPVSDSAQALVMTGNTGLQQAINWLLENGGKVGAGAAPPDDGVAAMALDEAAPTSDQLLARGAGITGILRRQQQEADAADSVLKEAFSDLKALEHKGMELVSLAERFRSTLSRRQDGSIAGEDGEAQMAMEEELIDLGIVSPVTKDTAGRSYHKELSRQLSDFLAKPVERAGGMLTMQEVYCLFNRARGTELVSPDDLTQAVNLFAAIRSPLRLRVFDSGVKVVCSDKLDYERVCTQLVELLQSPSAPSELGIGITERDAAQHLGLSLMVAHEHVLMAEQRGYLCRDDSEEGVRFFRNFFADAELPLA